MKNITPKILFNFHFGSKDDEYRMSLMIVINELFNIHHRLIDIYRPPIGVNFFPWELEFLNQIINEEHVTDEGENFIEYIANGKKYHHSFIVARSLFHSGNNLFGQSTSIEMIGSSSLENYIKLKNMYEQTF